MTESNNSLFSLEQSTLLGNDGDNPTSIKPESSYGKRLKEWRKIRKVYGNLSKKYLQNLFKKIKQSPSRKTDSIFSLLESRLDIVLYRAGFFESIPAARQMITCGKIKVSKKTICFPSYILSPGEIIAVSCSHFEQSSIEQSSIEQQTKQNHAKQLNKQYTTTFSQLRTKNGSLSCFPFKNKEKTIFFHKQDQKKHSTIKEKALLCTSNVDWQFKSSPYTIFFFCVPQPFFYTSKEQRRAQSTGKANSIFTQLSTQNLNYLKIHNFIHTFFPKNEERSYNIDKQSDNGIASLQLALEKQIAFRYIKKEKSCFYTRLALFITNRRKTTLFWNTQISFLNPLSLIQYSLSLFKKSKDRTEKQYNLYTPLKETITIDKIETFFYRTYLIYLKKQFALLQEKQPFFLNQQKSILFKHENPLDTKQLSTILDESIEKPLNFSLKPIHLEISYKSLSIIFLYRPQIVPISKVIDFSSVL